MTDEIKALARDLDRDVDRILKLLDDAILAEEDEDEKGDLLYAYDDLEMGGSYISAFVIDYCE